ncbi:SGNH/GDSL hydrolase family protein, partial [Pseudomonas asplenii]|uniref:SGNH/GDSL hydrolase family protein n=1 Tax=Pseudomonas asplenii TaxID=53407 RepID=UPI0018DEE0A6
WKREESEKTFENIKKIAYTLSNKGGKVIISTLLPRLDNHDDANRKVNSDLLEWGGTGCNCTILDLDSQFRKLNNKEQYFWDEGLHPNMLGYEKITNIVSKYLNAELNQVN